MAVLVKKQLRQFLSLSPCYNERVLSQELFRLLPNPLAEDCYLGSSANPSASGAGNNDYNMKMVVEAQVPQIEALLLSLKDLLILRPVIRPMLLPLYLQLLIHPGVIIRQISISLSRKSLFPVFLDVVCDF